MKQRHVRKPSVPSIGEQRGQRGAALLLVVAMLLGAALVLAGSFCASVVQKTQLNLAREQRIYLDGVIKNAHDWYQRVALTMEVAGDTPTESELLQKIAPDQKYGIRAQVSSRLGLPCASDATFGTCAPYRVIVVWLPPISSTDATSFTASTGSYVIDPVVLAAGTSRVFNTLLYQQGLMVQINERLKVTASRIQNYARAQQNLMGGASFENFLRSSDCSRTVSGHLPCLDTYTTITATTIPTLLGLPDSDFLTPWGDVMLISNLLDSSVSSMPYSLSLKASSPWGQTTTLQVQQTD